MMSARRIEHLITTAVCLALVAATLVVYWQAFGFGWVDLDDQGYVGATSGPVARGLTIEGVRWAFTDTHMANWHPLTWLSLMLDRTLQPEGWGLFHITNVALHLASTLLLYGVMRIMTGSGAGNQWASALVAAIFALHPAHVESVAWISERKDVLSGLLWMLTMWAHVHFVRAGAGGRWLWYAMALAFLALGLLAKPMLVTLPCVLLLLDFWPLRRVQAALGREPRSALTALRAMIPFALEKIPMFVLSAASSAITVLAQRSSGAVSHTGLHVRVTNAPISYLRYLHTFLWPDDLAVLYPLPGWYGQPYWPLWLAGLCAAVVTLITLVALALWRRAPFITVGWLWYVGTLLPVIGLFVQVGDQSMADRYTYIPFIGLSIMLAWTLRAIVLRWRPLGWVIVPTVVLALVILGAAARPQVGVWHDSDAMFQRALAVTRDNYRAHQMYGNTLMSEQRNAEAEQQLALCVQLAPGLAKGWNELGQSQFNQGKLASAAESFEHALQVDPANARGHFSLAKIAAQRGDRALVLSHLQKAVELEPANEDYRAALQYEMTATPR